MSCWAAFLPDDIKIVQVDIKPERLGRRAKVDLGLCGDVRSTLRALLPMLQQKKNDSFLRKQLKRYEGVKKDLAAYTEDKGKMDQIHPEYVMSEINNISSDDAIYTVDTGMTCVWGARYLQATGKRHMLGSFNHGSMANALPQAIGAALACNAFELEGPVLINVMTDPNALAMPPKIELGQMVGFAQSMYKLLINGRSQEVIDTINSNFKHIREVF